MDWLPHVIVNVLEELVHGQLIHHMESAMKIKAHPSGVNMVLFVLKFNSEFNI